MDAVTGEIADVGSFWRAIGVRAIGVAVVTAQDANGPAGFLALSATHLSADPPMMMVSIGLKTSALAAVLASRHFAINYVAQDGQELADWFGGKGDRKGADRFVAGDWTTLKTGAPVLVNGVGSLDCALDETIERHGAVIAIGRVVAYRARPDLKPLISFGGKYI